MRVADLCYVAIPGFLPTIAIHEILTNNLKSHRTLDRTARELLDIQNNFPQQWIRLITTLNLRHTANLQPSFAIPTVNAAEQPFPLAHCKTKHFYTHLWQTKMIPIPSLTHWQQSLSAPPIFDNRLWKMGYPSLATNKQGGINWKISLRLLPTALSLFRATVYHTPNCHTCQTTENIEHIFLQCPFTTILWTTVQTYIGKLPNNTLKLDDYMKLLGLRHKTHNNIDKRTQHLINWLLTIARYAIHLSLIHIWRCRRS